MDEMLVKVKVSMNSPLAAWWACHPPRSETRRSCAVRQVGRAWTAGNVAEVVGSVVGSVEGMVTGVVAGVRRRVVDVVAVQPANATRLGTMTPAMTYRRTATMFSRLAHRLGWQSWHFSRLKSGATSIDAAVEPTLTLVTESGRSWPPSTSMSPGDVTREVIIRLTEDFHIEGIRQTGAVLTGHGWIAQVGPWPDTQELVDSVRSALAPMEVSTFPHPSIPRRC